MTNIWYNMTYLYSFLFVFQAMAKVKMLILM
jgi:hypothetical protein